MHASRAQAPLTARGASPPTQRADSVQSSGPPLFLARPDVASRNGSFSVGTGGKVVVTHQADLSPHLHSSLDGALAFESLGDLPRAGGRDIRAGSMRWALVGKGGTRGEVGLVGDPASKMVRGSLEAPIPGGSVFNAYGTSRWTDTDWGRERVHYANVGLRTRVGPALSVQPEVHVIDAHAGSDVRWFGSNLRIECRGVEFLANHEGHFGNRLSTRKTWGVENTHWTLGGQLKQVPTLADARLLELGAAHGGIGGNLYWGTDQLAILLRVGALQLGFSQRLGLRQGVFGCKDWSVSIQRSEDGATEVGFGFVFRDSLRRTTRAAGGWRSLEPLPKSAGREPHVRWPGFGSVLY